MTFKGMPNNIEAEQAVLGSILIDDTAAEMLVPILRENDFYLAANRTIFAAMRALQQESKPVDTVSVADALETSRKLDEVGSIEYLNLLAESVPSAASGDHYADIVKRDALIRRVINAGNNIAKFGYESVSGTDALANAEREVYAIAEDITQKELVKADVALGIAMKKIQDAQLGNLPKNIIFTDFPSLDRMTRGLKPGEMVLIAARPSVGKTAFALNIAANACLNHNKTVAIFSLEMPGELLVKRMLSYVSKVSLTKMDMRGGLSSSVDNGKLYDAFRRLSETQLYIDDYSLNGPSDVLSKCRRLKRERGLDLVIIDYLQLMTNAGAAGRDNNRQQEVSDMSRKMKIYAKELDVPIILLSQMSRDVEKRDQHTPMLSDLRESGAIEQDADMVMFLNKENKFNSAVPENLVKLLIRKNRNGPVGDVLLEWDGDTTSFRECVDPGMIAAAKAPAEPVEKDRGGLKKSTESAKASDAAETEVAAQSAEKVAEKFADEIFADKEVKADSEAMPFETDEDEPPFDTDGDYVAPEPPPEEDDGYDDGDEFVDDGDDTDGDDLPF